MKLIQIFRKERALFRQKEIDELQEVCNNILSMDGMDTGGYYKKYK